MLDEPTASVDIKGEREIMDLVSSIRSQQNLTVIMVSHYIGSVGEYAENLILIDKDSGVFEHGPVKEIINSNSMQRIFGMKITLPEKGIDS